MVAVILIPVTLVAAVMMWKLRKGSVYHYSLITSLRAHGLTSSHPYKKILGSMRFLFLLALALLSAKPQVVDPHSKVHIEGVDMVLALDVSASMQFNDFDERTRLEVARQEALRFINKRDHDPIGLVLFGKHALSRCPLTLDKRMLHALLSEVKIGIVDADGTVLSRGLLLAVNRLKNSVAKSKIIILLTDGEPSEHDLPIKVALEAAKKFGIKIYTIGIGSQEQQYMMHPLFGYILLPKVNKELLDLLAHETGGTSFLAKNPDDMRSIYNTIDSLEKTAYETDLFSNYYDIFVPFALILCLLLLSELILATWVWFGI
jgi:Ca-activated chloride channel homolog